MKDYIKTVMCNGRKGRICLVSDDGATAEFDCAFAATLKVNGRKSRFALLSPVSDLEYIKRDECFAVRVEADGKVSRAVVECNDKTAAAVYAAYLRSLEKDKDKKRTDKEDKTE